VLNGQHSKHFQWKHGTSLDASGTVSWGVYHAKGEGRMTYIFAILLSGPLAATGIYNPQVTHHNRCIVEPGTFDALYCPAPAEPTHHSHGKK
jgi:hypothetical protein